MAEVSCIIPAYNEDIRIGAVLKVVAKHPLIKEVIVVDDHSRDDTRAVVRSFDRVRLIALRKNEGKSRAVLRGVNESTGDILFFLDADLIGLTEDHVSRLIAPVVSGRADIAISLRENAPWFFRKIGLDYISGERVFRKVLLAGHLKRINYLPGFGLETFMNTLIIKNGYRIKVVSWKHVISPWPHRKRGFLLGSFGFLKMLYQVFRTNLVFGAGYQIVQMLMLKIP